MKFVLGNIACFYFTSSKNIYDKIDIKRNTTISLPQWKRVVLRSKTNRYFQAIFRTPQNIAFLWGGECKVPNIILNFVLTILVTYILFYYDLNITCSLSTFRCSNMQQPRCRAFLCRVIWIVICSTNHFNRYCYDKCFVFPRCTYGWGQTWLA